jgi:hypothetical protein
LLDGDHTIFWLQVFAFQAPLTNTTRKEIKGFVKDWVPARVRRKVYWMPKEVKRMALVVLSGM